MSISKVNSKFKIIRKPDYSSQNSEASIKVEVSNKDSALNNKTFNDLIYKKDKDKNKEKKKEPQKRQSPERQNNKKSPSDLDTIQSVTDFYI